MDINGKLVLVTGGASGLGAACVEHFLDAGANVAVLDMNAQGSHDHKAQTVGAKIAYFDVDVTSAAAVSEAISAASELGEIRVCINCAGIAPAGKTVGRDGALDLDKFRQVIDVNLIGTFNVLRLAAEKMVELSPVDDDGLRGVIINTASVAAYEGQVGQAAYAASKGAVAAMTLPIARDLGPRGIRVNTIAPGVFGTPMLEGLNEEFKKPLEQAVQFPKRLGRPAEFAKLAAQIVDNDYLNGEVIRLDGGIRMGPR
ncbi:SDR family NAD(P)-dependent oxidoreductase [Arenicella xantha]|uniref:NAD(P)-dependent dehydrogenase (Short-subunit alcohol dehydrogenase family) n=1 Tax=Arenicella xantha TaxID=644221 RepID=A0A395JM20_9GAMM|nr:SDR family NAD(P)-dependent oxidoreductase [Arenicella xantha]RBP51649.1 NAD(P)-dependent dehydrogenase (short-subunit alcohol dehydrogenase family) [Arenicella xantha]